MSEPMTRLDRILIRKAAVNLDTEAEYWTEHLQLTRFSSTIQRNKTVEHRAKLYRAAKLLREITEAR